MSLKVLLIASSARGAALAEALTERDNVELHCICIIQNPDLLRLSQGRLTVGDVTDLCLVRDIAKQVRPDFAVVGPEAPLAAGVVDELAGLGIPCFGPTRELAQMESSKRFTRELLKRHGILGNPEFAVFESMDGVPDYLADLGEFAVKPDGLTGGKGVKVSGDHLANVAEGIAYAEKVLATHPCVIIEEKLEGEEFSLQSIVSGPRIADMPVVQDYKRAREGDLGPNTGGMGSYSCGNHSLPFLLALDVAEAGDINRAVAKALAREFETPYQGVLYGGFMATRTGVKLVEYNVRFGDPEAMNVLPLLEQSFVDVCDCLFSGRRLPRARLPSAHKATVCKYVVPAGYPEKPEKGATIWNVPESRDNLRVYYGSVNQEQGTGRLLLGGSRAVAFVGIGDTLAEAEAISEEAASQVQGPVRHRSDIGTDKLIAKRVAHMHTLLRGRA